MTFHSHTMSKAFTEVAEEIHAHVESLLQFKSPQHIAQLLNVVIDKELVNVNAEIQATSYKEIGTQLSQAYLKVCEQAIGSVNCGCRLSFAALRYATSDNELSIGVRSYAKTVEIHISCVDSSMNMPIARYVYAYTYTQFDAYNECIHAGTAVIRVMKN